MSMGPNRIAILVAVVGAIVLIIACVLGFRVLPDYIKGRIEEEVQLLPLSEVWEKWSDIDKPLYLNVYVLNITNADTILEDGYPRFAEVGPYAYRQRRRKVNITQNDGERLVSYEQKTWYFFDEEASGRGLTEDNLVTVLNLPFYLVLLSVANTIPGLLPIIPTFLPFEGLLRTVTVRELMFDGMDVTNITQFLSSNGFPVPEAFSGNRFGLYKGNNMSADSEYRIHTGVGDSTLFGEIMSWGGDSYLNYWQPLSPCDKVKGSDGSIFPPFVKEDRIVHVYSSDICRSIYFRFQQEEDVMGIKGYKFVLPPEVLEDPRLNEDNRCYCNKDDVEDCLGPGMIDISTCKSGAPFIVSQPHFMNAELNYTDFLGLQPDNSLHETALVIEPNSGVLLRANKRIQLNMDYRSLPIPLMNGTNSIVWPLVWFEESVEFTSDSATDLNDTLLSPKKAVETWRWVVVGLGIAIIVAGMGIYVWKGRPNKRVIRVNQE